MIQKKSKKPKNIYGKVLQNFYKQKNKLYTFLIKFLLRVNIIQLKVKILSKENQEIVTSLVVLVHLLKNNLIKSKFNLTIQHIKKNNQSLITQKGYLKPKKYKQINVIVFGYVLMVFGNLSLWMIIFHVQKILQIILNLLFAKLVKENYGLCYLKKLMQKFTVLILKSIMAINKEICKFLKYP